MNNLSESKVMKSLQAFSEKLINIKGFSALMKAFGGLMYVILFAAIVQILAAIPFSLKWVTAESAYYVNLMLLFNMTMGLTSVVAVVLISYTYAKELDLKSPMLKGIVALLLFLLVVSPVQTVTLADDAGAFTGLDATAMGGMGIFTAILIGLVSVKISKFVEDKNITIRMPEGVPNYIADSFTVLIPFAVNVIFWYGLSLLVTSVSGATLPMAIQNLLGKPIAALNSVPGMMVVTFLMMLFWFFGIHGTAVIFTPLVPVYIQSFMANADAVSNGVAPVLYPIFLLAAVGAAGGTGNPLPLTVMALRSKSQRLKAVSRAALVPGIFNISEPAIFGYPIMYNPILGVPFVLAPLAALIVVYIGFAIGFFKAPYVMLMGMFPLGVSEFLTTLAWQNTLIPVVAFVVGFLIWYPFFKAYESRLVKEEAAEIAEEEASAEYAASMAAGV